MWGIIPAAGRGSRIQPLAFSKELLPVGSRLEGGAERPRAISEYLVERMIRAGARKLCFVISPGKSDILEYFGDRVGPADICYVIQPRASGLCDAIFRARHLVSPEEPVVVGLPDTIWFPEDGLRRLEAPPAGQMLSFLLFPVEQPQLFDAVLTDGKGNVQEIRVKQPQPGSKWIWGAFRMPGTVFHALHELWSRPERGDEYIGTLVNAWLAGGGRARAVRAGRSYVDVGTLHGYREAIRLLERQGRPRRAAQAAARRKAPGSRPAGRGSAAASRIWTRERVERRIRELGGWFQNFDLAGVRTAPDHFLGDYPGLKWRAFAHALPADLSGRTVLDIGCNAGFYAIEMRKRGAERVVGIDWDEDYLAQARFATEVSGFPEIELRRMSVYDVADLRERFDLVLFLGVLYHLRHPLLALDLIHEHVTRDLLVIQSLQRGGAEVEPVEEDYPFERKDIFDRPGWPKLHFVERRYCGDITNWWIPNRACSEAMLRAAGYRILEHPEEEVYICRHEEPQEDIAGPRAVYPAGRAARGAGHG